MATRKTKTKAKPTETAMMAVHVMFVVRSSDCSWWRCQRTFASTELLPVNMLAELRRSFEQTLPAKRWGKEQWLLSRLGPQADAAA